MRGSVYRFEHFLQVVLGDCSDIFDAMVFKNSNCSIEDNINKPVTVKHLFGDCYTFIRYKTCDGI